MADGEGLRFDVTGLDSLFESLTQAGFKVGPAGRTRAATLVTEFLARDALPVDARDFALWLMPIFVTRAEERGRFVEAVLTWARAAHRLDVAAAPAPKLAVVDPEWRNKLATPPPKRVPWWRKIPKWVPYAVGAAAFVGVMSAIPPVRETAVSAYLTIRQMLAPAPEAPSDVEAAVPGPVAPAPEAQEERDEATAPVAREAASEGALAALTATLSARAARFGYVPTLEELYREDAAPAGLNAEDALPDDAQSVSERLGIPIDRPLPLTRMDVLERLLSAMAPEEIAALSQGLETSDPRLRELVAERDNVTRVVRALGPGGRTVAAPSTRSRTSVAAPEANGDGPNGLVKREVELNAEIDARMEAARHERLMAIARPIVAAAGQSASIRLAAGDGPASTVLTDTEGRSEAVAYSPDGRHLAVATSAEAAIVFDASTGQVVLRLTGHEEAVEGVAYSVDGGRIVTASQDSTARIWNAADGAALLTIGPVESGAIYSASFSPDGSRVATASQDGTPRVWDAQTGAQLLTLEGHEDGTPSAVYSADGILIVTASWDDTARIWDAGSGATVRVLRGHTDNLVNAVFSPDGTRVLTVSVDTTARVWNTETGAELMVLRGHTDSVQRGVFSPDGAYILTGSSDGTARLWDAVSGAQVAVLRGVGASLGGVAFDPDGQGVATGFGNFDDFSLSPATGELPAANDANIMARIWRPLVLAAGPIAAEMEHRALSKAELGDLVRHHLGLPDFTDLDPAQNPNDDPSLPLAERVALAEEALAPGERQALGEARAASASDDDIARAWAALSFDAGLPLNIADPPWPSRYAVAVDPAAALKANAHWIAACAVLLGAALVWLWSAINARGFLARRRPDDPGRIADLAAEDRARSERADQSIRLAARRMLERRESARALDIMATVEATARAGGFFTPVSRPHRRIPEYLFLIDSRSRFDHDAKRALDYVQRLRAENVKADYYFFEQAPDRVREDIGKPLVPIETITSQFATRRLVIVGDAAAMLEPSGRGAGWLDTMKVWEDRALLTTVPTSEWGVEEERLTHALGVLVRPLSAASLAALPGEMRDAGGEGQSRIAHAHGLSDRPLPAPLREASYRWTLELEPPRAEVDAMLAELSAYLGQHGFRWLAACAVYPAIEWDLTMALGWRLKEGEAGEERPLVTEKRVALIAELPWMRTGLMPQWLRERLIEMMDSRDRQSVRAFLGEILDAARDTRRAPRDAIALSFSVEGGRGRDAFGDDVFVQFLLEDPRGRDTRALEATKKVRDLLLPPLAARLLRPREFAILIGGAILAAAAYFFAPRFTDAPLTAGAWAPLAALALAPILFWHARRSVPQGVAAAWRWVRDPLDPWRDWRARAAEDRGLRERDRLGYFRAAAPGARRLAVGLIALVLAALVAAQIGAFTAALWIVTGRFGGLRSLLGDAFGAVAWALVALAFATAWFLARFCLRDIDQRLNRWAVPRGDDRGSVWAIGAIAAAAFGAGACGAAVVNLIQQGAMTQGLALLQAAGVLFWPAAIGAAAATWRYQRIQKRLARLTLRLGERRSDTQRAEVGVRGTSDQPRLADRLVVALKRCGIGAARWSAQPGAQTLALLAEEALSEADGANTALATVPFAASAFRGWRRELDDPRFQRLLKRAAKRLGETTALVEIALHETPDGERNLRGTLEIDRASAANGARRLLRLQDGRTVETTIPAGVESGLVLRLKGQGQYGAKGGAPGDLLVELRVIDIAAKKGAA